MNAELMTAKIVDRFPVWFLFNPDESATGEILLQHDGRTKCRANVFTKEDVVKSFLDGSPQYAKYVSVPLFSPGGFLYFLDIIERRGATHLILNEQSDEERLVPITELRHSMRGS